MKKINILIILSFVGHFLFAQTTWKIDKNHSKISFSVTHMVVSEVEGNFKQFEGSIISSSENDFHSAQVEFKAQVASLDTDNEQRDIHLRSDHFFDAKKFPTISFKGKLDREGTKYQLRGILTMKGIAKNIIFDVTFNGLVDTGKGTKAGFKFNGLINRNDYGIKWNKKLATGNFVVGDEVTINCSLELNKM